MTSEAPPDFEPVGWGRRDPCISPRRAPANGSTRWVAALIAVATACGPSASLPDASIIPCPTALPASCPMPIPSYAHDVAPIIAASCLSCHGADGGTSYGPLATYAQVAVMSTSIRTQLVTCRMPPPPATLSQADRETLLGWIVCATPNN